MIRCVKAAIVILLFAGPLIAQQPSGVNPLAKLKDELKQVLAEASLP